MQGPDHTVVPMCSHNSADRSFPLCFLCTSVLCPSLFHHLSSSFLNLVALPTTALFFPSSSISLLRSLSFPPPLFFGLFKGWHQLLGPFSSWLLLAAGPAASSQPMALARQGDRLLSGCSNFHSPILAILWGLKMAYAALMRSDFRRHASKL